VSQASGLIKYELIDIDYKIVATDGFWDRKSYVGELYVPDEQSATVKATILLQIIGDQNLKAEIFVGQTADEVSAFTSNATIYDR